MPSRARARHRSAMRIRFHKILNEGRSVRYEKSSEDRDVIDLSAFAGIDNFGEVGAQASQVLADVVIDLGAAAGGAAGADVLTLASFSLANLNAADLVFA